MGVKLGLLH